MTDRIFLDAITTTKPSGQCVQALLPFFETCFGSSSSPHQMGSELVAHTEKSIAAIFDLFGAAADAQFVFTSSGAEAVSQVIMSVYRSVVRKLGKNHFVTRSIDEAPAIFAISQLEEEECYLRMAECSKQGYVTCNALGDAISARTALVSMSLTCGLTGVIQPVEEIAALCKERGILLHLDVTHAVGKLDVLLTHADCITCNGEQFHAPKGTGILLANKNFHLHPLIHGEGEQEQLRGGALNVPMLVSLGQAALEAKQHQNLYCTEVARLRALFELGLEEAYPEAQVLFQSEQRLPHCTAVTFPGIHSELLAFALSRKGVYACMGGGPFQQMEKVLAACQVDPLLAQTALSFSLSKDTQEAEIERAIVIIADVAKRLRRVSKAVV
jgi:cysteine desulfurase